MSDTNDNFKGRIMWGNAQAMKAPSVVYVRGISVHSEPETPTYICEVVNDGSVIWQQSEDLHPLESPEDWDAFTKARRAGCIASAEKLIERMRQEEAPNPLETEDQP